MPAEAISRFSTFKSGELAWHYTDFRGLQGLLSGSVWASSAAYLNDTQEIRAAIEIATRVIAEYPELNAEYPNTLGMTNADIFRHFDGRDIFVASFSQKRDDLSQWRAYGKKGPAFAVGLNPRTLNEQGSKVQFEFVRVRYNRERIEASIRRRLRRYSEKAKETINSASPGLKAVDFSVFFTTEIVRLAARSKDSSFRSEREWRLVRNIGWTNSHVRKFKFREFGSLVIPYVEVPLHQTNDGAAIDSPIKEIIVGPSPHPEALKHSVEMMAAVQGLRVEVSSSSIPLRNW